MPPKNGEGESEWGSVWDKCVGQVGQVCGTSVWDKRVGQVCGTGGEGNTQEVPTSL